MVTNSINECGWHRWKLSEVLLILHMVKLLRSEAKANILEEQGEEEAIDVSVTRSKRNENRVGSNKLKIPKQSKMLK